MITKDDLKKLKSGTDVRGTAVECENEKINLTDEAVEKICMSFVRFVTRRAGKEKLRIALGTDVRISAQRIKKAALSAFMQEGVQVYDLSVASTPAVFMAIVTDIKVDAALEITASHMPYHKNGLKFFTKDGSLESSELDEILSEAADIQPGGKTGSVVQYDFMSVYCASLRRLIINETGGDRPLSGLKIAVDAGNGAGGFFATDVLAPLGADISGSTFLEPNGMFPNHIPNPEDKSAITAASESVLKSASDFGFVFDTDVDRVGCIAGNGSEINRNRLVALASVIALQNNKGGVVVTDSLTSDGLRAFIENNLQSKQLRYKRGYKNVIDKAKELNAAGINAPLAIETSGHAALRENYFLDDGAYLAAKITALLARLSKNKQSVSTLISSLKEPLYSAEIRIFITEPDFKPYGRMVLGELEKYAPSKDGWAIEKDNYEGVRVNLKEGWFLLRLSLHDPILPLNIETDSKAEFENTKKSLGAFFGRFSALKLPEEI
ncbi:MAG: phosphomannomutase/phosphoglucomutase [Clostridiales bacterium]|nr:phosphomannomutase/phosphoglucomutase [Clostridiales bacterium]